MEAAQPPGQPVYGQPPPRRTHPLSIISFICSLLWLFWLGSIVGVITGHVARRDIRRDPSASGDGLAIAGLVLGYIGIGALVLVLAVAMVAGTSGTSGGSPFRRGLHRHELQRRDLRSGRRRPLRELAGDSGTDPRGLRGDGRGCPAAEPSG